MCISVTGEIIAKIYEMMSGKYFFVYNLKDQRRAGIIYVLLLYIRYINRAITFLNSSLLIDVKIIK